HHAPGRYGLPPARRQRPRANSRGEAKQLVEAARRGASASKLRRGSNGKKKWGAIKSRNAISPLYRNEKAGAFAPARSNPGPYAEVQHCQLIEIVWLSAARVDTATGRERIRIATDTHRNSTTVATIRTGIAVIAIADATAKDRAEDAPEDRSNTITRGRVRS